MSKLATKRKRCSQCRRWFTPPARLAKQQRVCSAGCRLKRRAKQARFRRSKKPQWYRQEERERKRRSRQVQRLARSEGEGQQAVTGEHVGTDVSAGHAPGRGPKRRESQRKFDDLWDRLLDVSRAGLEREVRNIARQMWRELRQEPATRAAGHGPGGFPIS